MGKYILSFDLGAESGRLVVGNIDGDRLIIEEIHRFPNTPVYINGHLFWDVLRLFQDMKEGLLKFRQKHGDNIASFGIDTWGVDFGLLDKRGNLIGNPYHYRDSRTNNIMDEVFKIIPKKEMFFKTGIQFMQLNTVFQLYSMVKEKDPLLNIADKLLLIPNLFSYFFTGKKEAEFTITSTTQLYDYKNRDWHWEIIKALGIPEHIFPTIVPAGTTYGEPLSYIKRELGLSGGVVILPGAHDTASAVASVPARGEKWAYLSSGTWSLMGVEVDIPVINEKTYRYNFTNEGGVLGNIRLLKNIMGLWLMQGVRRATIKRGEEKSYDELVRLAEEAEPFIGIINPDDPIFFNPPDMIEAVKKYLKKTGQKAPEELGSIVRIVIESLALKYRYVFELLEEIIESEIDVLHIVGGGIKNRLLSQFSADAIGKKVIAGPIEATTIGNILIQGIALGKIKNLEKGRDIVRESFPLKEFFPKEDKAGWDEAFEKAKKLFTS